MGVIFAATYIYIGRNKLSAECGDSWMLSQGISRRLTVNNRDFVLVFTGLGKKKQLWLTEIKGGGLFLFVFKDRERMGEGEMGGGREKRLKFIDS